MKKLFGILMFLALALPANAQDDKSPESGSTEKADQKDSEEKPADKIPLLPVKVRVVDSTGAPVPGAKVKPRGLRARAARGSHYGWYEAIHGKQPEATTNEDGIAELVYPKFIYEKLETGEVTWFVDHPDYVRFSEDRDVSDEIAKITLKSGFRIAATAVGSDGKRIKENLFALQSGQNGEWEMKKGGVLTSRVFDRKQSALRMVYLPTDGDVLYSDLEQVYPKPDQMRVFLRDIKLKVGCRVEGSIDESVPRPIKNGTVVCVIVAPGAPGPDGGEESWTFNTGAKIDADGKFVFKSLPRGEVIQLIAICDGWISKQPDVNQVKKDFPNLLRRNVTVGRQRYPQVFQLAEPVSRPVITMEKTGTVRLTVKSPDGEPLADTTVQMWPNQIFFSYGSQLLGANYDMLKVLRDKRDGKTSGPGGFQQRYSAKTNEQGVATIGCLPGPGSQGLAVQHPKYVLSVQNGRRSCEVVIKPGEVTEMTVTLKERGENQVGQ